MHAYKFYCRQNKTNRKTQKNAPLARYFPVNAEFESNIEELNIIENGADYGWPYIYGDGKFNASDPPLNDITYS